MSSMVGPRRLYRLLVELTPSRGRAGVVGLARGDARWRVRVTQTTLMARLGCTLRTLQRWTAQLRQLGWIATRQSVDGRGYRSVNTYELLAPPPTDDLGGPDEGKNVPGHSEPPAAAPLLVGASLRSEASPQDCPISEVCNEEHVVGGTEQLSLFDEPQLDGPVEVSNTGVDQNGAPTPEKRRTPANRVMAYWLKGRAKRPSPGAVAGMAGAVRKCIESGITESEICAAFDALMRQGLDWSSTQLLAYFNLGHSKKPKRDYTTDPLRKRPPRQSAMTPERTRALAENRFGSTLSRDAVRSYARRMSASLRSSMGSSPAGDAARPAGSAPLPEHRRAALEALYVQECREQGRNPVESSKGVIAGLMARLRTASAGAR